MHALTSDPPLPLSALLSHALVAFTIEFDNEFEHRMPHRTTSFGATPNAPHAPWLVSMVMWMNCMQYISDTGTTVRELYRESHVNKKNLRATLSGMERWGYLKVERPSAGKRTETAGSRSVKLTAAGRMAQTIWRPLVAEIEERWRKRFGKEKIEQLQAALAAVAEQFDCELPMGMPIVEYGLVTAEPAKAVKHSGRVVSAMSLPALLAGVLMKFGMEFERASPVSLALSANVLRILDNKGVPVKELPRLSAISKETVEVSLNFLQKRSFLLVERRSSGQSKIARLTRTGVGAQRQYWGMVAKTEERWRERFGARNLNSLRKSLERVVGDAEASKSTFFGGIVSYSDGWRSAIMKPDGLPHYPVVTHRGGFPDGS